MKPNVSVIFPHLNGKVRLLQKLVNSVKTQKEIATEIIMVDNGSSLDHLTKVSSYFPSLKIIRLKTNWGYAKAVNLGARINKSKYLFFTNDDCELAPKCLITLVDYLKHHPQVAIVGPISYKDKKLTQIDSAVQKFSLTTGLFKVLPCTEPTESDWISGSGLMISKNNFSKLNGFDERFFFYYEDLDLCLRTKKTTGKVFCLPDAIIIHSRGTTANNKVNLTRSLYYLHMAKQQLLLKHGNVFQIIIGLFLHLFIFSVYHLIILRDKSFIPMLKATLENIRHKPRF